MTRIEAPYSFVEKYYTDDLAEIDSPESRFYLSWLKNVKGDRVLDIGCGPNLFDDVAYFASMPKELVGMDLNKNNIEFLAKSDHPQLLKARKSLFDSKVRIELINGDIFIPMDRFDGYFDCIYSIGVVANFNEAKIRELMGIVNRYLKKGGLFLDVSWTDCRLSEEKYRERVSYGWFSKEAPKIGRIGGIISESGFKVMKHDVYDVPNKEEYKWGKIYGYLAQKV